MIIVGQSVLGMQPDFVHHPAKVEKASYLFGRTAKGNSCHGKNLDFLS
jgi:hypothetical protein